MNLETFTQKIWQYYKENKRNFPWRDNLSPYSIFISEVMLQQTQTGRVVEKYNSFIKHFPSFESLAAAPFSEVLKEWSGLGYNRRAKFLQDSAKIIINQFNNSLPTSEEELIKLPGIGKATASSIVTFAYNIPTVFIETNIRRVFIHEFFKDRIDVSDMELLPLIKQSLDTQNPREWYYALMDYGAYLSKIVENPNRKSKHYTRQSPFENSIRRVRGEILKLLLSHPSLPEEVIKKEIKGNPDHLPIALEQLVKEGFLFLKGQEYSLSS